jgi:hypothetical protein
MFCLLWKGRFIVKRVIAGGVCFFLFLSLFSPFKTSKILAAINTKEATFIAVRWVPVGKTREGADLSNSGLFPWQRRSEEVWGRSGYPMPRPSAPRPAGTSSARALFYTEVYLKIKANGGSSQESEHYFVVLDDFGQLWFDVDGRFQDSREASGFGDRCSKNSNKVDNLASNNTMGPYRIGEYIHFDFSKGYQFSPSGALNPIKTFASDYSGRVFKLGEATLGQSGTKVLLMSELLFASCENWSYDISVESDLWYGTNPPTTTARLTSPNGDVPINAQRVQNSTVLDPTGDKFFAPATTFHQIRLKYREYIGVEIWKDNGVNANQLGGSTVPSNLSDDYISGRTCEEFLGMKSGETDTDSFLSLVPFPPNVKFYGTNGTQLGCGATLYQDLDLSATVTEGDLRLTGIRVTIGNNVIDYPARSTVTSGDADIGFVLQPLSLERYFDTNENSEFNIGDFIYRDANADGKVSGSDVRLTDVLYRSSTYLCGSMVRTGDVWTVENPVTGITMGRCGDFRFMDMEVLPSQTTVDAKIYPPLQVEQTSNIDIRIAPPLQSGETAYIVFRTGTGADIIREIHDVSNTFTFTYTPYEGSCSDLGKSEPIQLEVYRNLDFNNDGTGPRDGDYGYWKVETSRSIPTFENKYDCRSFQNVTILPELIKAKSNVTCLTNVSLRFPNMILKLTDADNPGDVNDPANLTMSSVVGRNLLANYNVTGAGISNIFTAKDTMNNKYIVQDNNDGSYLLWKWVDNPNPPAGKGYYGALDFSDTITGPFSSADGIPLSNGRWEDKDCSANFLECDTCRTGNLPTLGKITEGDTFGIFDGTFGTILCDGVWAFVLPYGEGLITREGGEIPLAFMPRDSGSSAMVRIFTNNALYDYNSSIQHPPYFITSTSRGIDYCGIFDMGWKNTDPNPPPPPPEDPNPPDPPGGGGGGRNDGISFSEMVVVDHALQYSKASYTTNINPDYDPTLPHLIRDFRGYPGGQTHTGRAGYIDREGRNAYPAIWENQFVKLGTEFMPMADYGFYFVLRDSQDGGILSFDATDRSHKVTSITLTGPFLTPHFPLSRTSYGGLSNIPITYDDRGEIEIDSSNYKEYELVGADFTKVTNPGKQNPVTYQQANSYLQYSRKLNYSGIPRVIVIDEIIPVLYGKIQITVKLADGRVGNYFECCDTPMEGIPVRALDIGGYTGGVEYNKDSDFAVVVKEHEPIQSEKLVNDAMVVLWQDRGIRTYGGSEVKGAGDGWLTGAPESSAGSGAYGAFSRQDDLNEDGKISFNDWETEIVGSYDLATNSWAGGMKDARTFQVNNGTYRFRLTEATRCVVDSVGYDFNGNNLIDDTEILPLILSAYKYGDDNNDRGFSPMFSSPIDNKLFSHEVYIAGQSYVPIGYSSGPEKALVLTMTPPVLTAGVSSETIFKGDPFTIKITDESGSPIDLTNKGKLSATEVANLFFDDVPTTLPDYYWLRTDLHNQSTDGSSNESLFGVKNLIKYDFSEASKGLYHFKNFVANDKGSFKLRVITADNRKFGSLDVKVEMPKIEYSLKNSIGDKDDPMVGDVYEVTATIKDAQGQTMLGTGLNFLPYIVPASKTAKAGNYWIAFGKTSILLDKTYTTLLDTEKRRLNKADWFGNGCLFNSPYDGIYLLGDVNKDSIMSVKDALPSSDGKVTFSVYASAPFQVGGLVGFNSLLQDSALSDVAGKKPEDNGSSLKRRYKPDGAFMVDWFTLGQEKVKIKPLSFQVEDFSGKLLPTTAFDLANPDLIASKKNQLQITFGQPIAYIHEWSLLENQKEIARGKLENDVRIKTEITPKFAGKGIITGLLQFEFPGVPPFQAEFVQFDVVEGISVKIIRGEAQFTDVSGEILLQFESSGGSSLKDLKATLKGAGIDSTETIDDSGLALFQIKPTSPGEIRITLSGPNSLTSPPVILVYDSSIPPELTIDPYPDKTKGKEVDITGKTLPNCKLFVGSSPENVRADGTFSVKLKLVEGLNEIVLQAVNPKGFKNEKVVKIVLIVKGPEILVDPIPKDLTDITEYTLTGSVNPENSKLWVEDQQVPVTSGKFSAKVPVKAGENKIKMKATDEFDTETVIEVSIWVYQKIVIVLTIGKNVMMRNGRTSQLDAPPFIANNRTMVPLRAIAEAFGATVNWQAKTETVEIALEKAFISMQIGNTVAMIGTKIYMLDAPPVIKKGRTFVPIRFIAEALGSVVLWDAKTQTVQIERLILN